MRFESMRWLNHLLVHGRMPAQWVGAPEIIHVQVRVTVRAAEHSVASGVNRAAAGPTIHRTADSRRPCGFPTDRHSTPAASDRRSPSVAPRGDDCWRCTTGERRRAPRRVRHMARSAWSMPRRQQALTTVRPRPARQTVHAARPPLRAESRHPSRERRGDRPVRVAHGQGSRQGHSTPGRCVRARTGSPGVE